MSAEPYLFDQIDDFLTGKLTQTDLAKMEKAILEHADLAQEVRLRRLEFDITESLIAADIRTQLAQLRKQAGGDTTTPVSPANVRKRAITIGLLMLIIGLLIWGMFRLTNPKAPEPTSPLPQQQHIPTNTFDPQKPAKQEDAIPTNQVNKAAPPMASNFSKRLALAATAYSRPDFEQVRGSATAPDSFDIILDAWHKNDYRTVEKAVSKIGTDSPLYIKSRYILAHALYLSGNYGRAATVFGQAADSKMMPYAEEADWYVILALLSETTDNKNALHQRMERILKTPDHTYFKECKQLSEKL
jgi:hypothetical protein